MDTLLQHLFCSTKEASREHDNRGGTVTRLHILRGRKIDKLIHYEEQTRTNMLRTRTIFAAGCRA